MDKLKMHSLNKVDENIKKIGAQFPNCITERKNQRGEVEYAIDFDLLKQELSSVIVEGREERYQFTWPDKKKSILLANAPIAKTLRPCREESVDFDDTENLYIEGDNLEVLKLLQETYLEKIDLIYIDPPYNTGNDILYINDYIDREDEFHKKYEIDEQGNRLYLNTDMNGRYHTNWLNMMYQRIKIAKDLIKNDGFFLVAIDHNELFNLGEICDEIFGYSNRVGVISVVHKPEGRNQAKFIGPSNEFMLVYAKNEDKAKLQKVILDEEQKKAFSCQDENGAYRLKNFIRLSDGKYATKESKPTFWYPIYVTEDLKTLSYTKIEHSVAIYPITDSGVERTWKTTKETFLERYQNGDIIAQKEGNKIRIYEKLRENQVIKTHWVDKKYHGYHFGTKILDEILGVKTFDFPKSLYLMRDIIKLFCPKDGIVLDFFSGSATSAHAIMLANHEDCGNRKFILAQIPAACNEKSEAYKAGYKNICEIGKERIRRAGNKIAQENPQAKFDKGFRVLKCDSSNMKEVYYNPAEYNTDLLDSLLDNIKADRTPEDLLFQVMLDLGVLLSSDIKQTTIAGKTVFNVADNFLMACFDTDINEEVITAIAKQKPYYFVMRDSSMENDSVATNFEQIFNTYSPETKRKVL
ncbi:Type III restriction-modification system methylation subunit [Snodgrassella communis]|uniref:site-specific DNA-methyltransferase n=1 Tax=Snodgrassella communis TaxID=2946699 RepID=UPI000461F16A|nr:site-specific DNA-methyltransferase [Snodgrassella communis]KDN12322.1 Type III restriction-modification system methylation subunit [Snodgrassella communis]